MSQKNRDKHNRFRCKSVVFRVSPEEAEELNRAVAISGLPKQEYCYRRCMCREITVEGNPRVYIALKKLHIEVLDELKRISAGENVSVDLLTTIGLMTITLQGLQEEPVWKQKKR